MVKTEEATAPGHCSWAMTSSWALMDHQGRSRFGSNCAIELCRNCPSRLSGVGGNPRPVGVVCAVVFGCVNDAYEAHSLKSLHLDSVMAEQPTVPHLDVQRFQGQAGVAFAGSRIPANGRIPREVCRGSPCQQGPRELCRLWSLPLRLSVDAPQALDGALRPSQRPGRVASGLVAGPARAKPGMGPLVPVSGQNSHPPDDVTCL